MPARSDDPITIPINTLGGNSTTLTITVRQALRLYLTLERLLGFNVITHEITPAQAEGIRKLVDKAMVDPQWGELAVVPSPNPKEAFMAGWGRAMEEGCEKRLIDAEQAWREYTKDRS